MKKILSVFLIFILYYQSYSQSDKFQLQLRLPLQIDRQKAEIIYSWGTQVQRSNAINFGLDALMSYQKKNFAVYSGLGFFRNKFYIKRGYDHQALNPGRDSLPIGTETKNYVYLILRVPIGIEYRVMQTKGFSLGVGVEYLFNFSFRRNYNGDVPFKGANTIYKGFSNFGNSLDFFIALSKTTIKKTISLELFVHIYNRYHKDKFLKENENESISRYFDAIGINLKYSFTLLKFRL